MAIGFDCRDVAARASDHIEGALPWTQRGRVLGHLAGCAHCRRLVRQLRATSGALTLLGAGVPVAPVRRRRLPAPIPALAGAALTVLLASALVLVPTLGMQRAVYAHAVDPHARPGPPVPPRATATVLAGVGARFAADPPQVVFVELCPLRGHAVPHLLVMHDRQLVTVLVLPFGTREGRFVRGRLHGVLVHAGPGTLAVLAPTPQAAREVAASVGARLRWEAPGRG